MPFAYASGSDDRAAKHGGGHHNAPGKQGQAMAEYAVILALVTLIATAAYVLLGGPIAGLYTQIVSAF